MSREYLQLLKEEMKLLEGAMTALKHSYDACTIIGIKDNYGLEELERFEALSSRFARASDIFIQKILRLIEEIDLESPGTVRDRINRAEKKGIIDAAEDLITIRNLRNDIAHEYMPDVIKEIFKSVLAYCPYLFKCLDSLKQYCQKYHSAIEDA